MNPLEMSEIYELSSCQEEDFWRSISHTNVEVGCFQRERRPSTRNTAGDGLFFPMDFIEMKSVGWRSPMGICSGWNILEKVTHEGTVLTEKHLRNESLQ